MLDKVIWRIVLAVLIICVIVLGWVFSILLIFNRQVEIPITIVNYKNYYEALSILQKELGKNPCKFNDSQYKEYVEKDLGLSFYIYKEKDLGNKFNGKAYPTIRTIFLHEELTGYEYCEVFVHEAIHIKRCIKNEKYVCYETFKYLYEDEVLHHVGVAYAWKQMNTSYSWDYNIQTQVIYYLTNQ